MKLGRVGDVPVPGEMQTTVRFYVQETPVWKGAEPTKTQLQLARQLVARALERGASEEGDVLDGLDHDRRLVVQPWVDELFADIRAQRSEAMAIQLARIASENDLRLLLAGQYVPLPDPDLFETAAPVSKATEDAFKELKRRYCERYSCDSSEGANQSR